MGTNSITPKEVIGMGFEIQEATCFHNNFTPGGLLASSFDPDIGFDLEYGHSNGVLPERFPQPVCKEFMGRQICLRGVRARTFGGSYFWVNHETTQFETSFSINKGRRSATCAVVQSRSSTFIDDDKMYHMEGNAEAWGCSSSYDNIYGDCMGLGAETLIQIRGELSDTLRRGVNFIINGCFGGCSDSGC